MSSVKRVESGMVCEPAVKKRRKGAIRLSCAECRRLKLRCDRGVPCGSCVKRGCSAICPDGSLTTGQGNRFVLASTQELHEHINTLCIRIRELEDALRSSYTQLSTSPHPLLSEELLRIKAPLQRESTQGTYPTPNGVVDEERNPDVVDAFGSLSISVTGRAKYFGHTANSWYFLQNELPADDSEGSQSPELRDILPQEVLNQSAAFPVAPDSRASIGIDTSTLSNIFWYLPPAEKAIELHQIYHRHASWMYNPISSTDFHEQIYVHFYDQNVAPSMDDPLLSHRLALLFIVLAIGSLMDTSGPAYSIEAEKYHQLARAALFRSTLFDEPTITAVQALFLMSVYLFLADRHGSNSGTRWAIMGLAVKVAQSIGLHRDSGRWNIEADEAQRRRELFWELYTCDSWQCLTFGRPPSLALPHVDCKMPYKSGATDETAFHAWKHRFSAECMSLIHDQAFGAKTPTYATIIQLDRKLRAFSVPPILQVAGFGTSQSQTDGLRDSVMLTLQRHIVLAIREMTLLYLHRGFFARALTDHPKDPLGSPYGTSVIAAYRSAGSLIALMRNLHSQLKEPSERMWFLWTHMFSCAIVLGSIVTRCPSMSLAPSALLQLDSACALFAKAAAGFRAQRVLTVMQKLQEKAHASLADFRSGRSQPSSRQGSLSAPGSPGDDDELSTLGGRTRLIAKKEPSSPSPRALLDRSPMPLPSVVPLPLNGDSQHVHPNVVDYLRTFGGHTNGEQFVNPSSVLQSYPDSPMFDLSDPIHTNGDAISYKQPQLHQFEDQVQFSNHIHPEDTAFNMISDAFPQYFPVYDYRQVEPSADGLFTFVDTIGSGLRTNSNSPELNTMQTSWNNFVAGFA